MQSDQRRRRLRLIKTIEERSTKQFRSAVSALAIASDTEFARLDADAIRQKLMLECRVNTSSVLRIEHPGTAPMDIAMDRPYLLIGSDPDCDLRLDHDEVKAHHCFLQWIEGHLFCCDVEKKNGYFPLNDSQPNGEWIKQEPIAVGPYRLSLLGIDSPTSPNFIPLDRSTRLASEFPYLALRFDGVEQSENMWPVNRMLTLIGRGVQCKLRLNHRSMGNIHAALLRTSTGCWVIDLVRDGSTCVNGRAIQISPIDAGDELQFGEFRVEVVALGGPSVTSAVGSMPEVKKFGISSDKSLPPIRFDRQQKESPAKTGYVAKPIVNRAPVHQVATIVPEAVVKEDPVQEMPVHQSPQLQSPPLQSSPQQTSIAQKPVANEQVMQSSVLEKLVLQAPTIRKSSPQTLLPQTTQTETVVLHAGGPAVSAPEPVLSHTGERGLIDRKWTTEVTKAPGLREDAPDPATHALTDVKSLPVSKATALKPPEPQMTASQTHESTDFLQRSAANVATSAAKMETSVDAPPSSDTDDLLKETIARSKPSRDTTEVCNTTCATHQQGEPIVKELMEGGTADAISNSKKTDINSDSKSVAEFLKQQQQELTALKEQLHELKRIYENAAGQLISKKMRDSLEKPVVETLQCHDSMQEKLNQFMRQVGR